MFSSDTKLLGVSSEIGVNKMDLYQLHTLAFVELKETEQEKEASTWRAKPFSSTRTHIFRGIVI